MARAPRGFTVVELLIVLTLLVAIGSVVLSTAVGWSVDEQIRSVETGLTAAAREARAMALRERSPVELVAEPNRDGLWDVRLVAARVVDEEAEFAIDADSEALPVEDDQPDPAAGEIVYQLPAAGAFERTDSSVSEFDPEGEASIVLIRILPDGWAMIPEPSWRVRFGETTLSPGLEAWLAEVKLSVEQPELGFDEVEAEPMEFGP